MVVLLFFFSRPGCLDALAGLNLKTVDQRSVLADLLEFFDVVGIGFLDRWASRNLGHTDTPPATVSTGHRARSDLDIKDAGTILLLGILERSEKFRFSGDVVALAP